MITKGPGRAGRHSSHRPDPTPSISAVGISRSVGDSRHEGGPRAENDLSAAGGPRWRRGASRHIPAACISQGQFTQNGGKQGPASRKEEGLPVPSDQSRSMKAAPPVWPRNSASGAGLAWSRVAARASAGPVPQAATPRPPPPPPPSVRCCAAGIRAAGTRLRQRHLRPVQVACLRVTTPWPAIPPGPAAGGLPASIAQGPAAPCPDRPGAACRLVPEDQAALRDGPAQRPSGASG